VRVTTGGAALQAVPVVTGAITTISFTRGGGATGATIAWTNAAGTTIAQPPGITVNLTANPITISGTPAAGVGTFNYTVTTTGGTCTASQSGTITVSLPPNCNGNTPGWGANLGTITWGNHTNTDINTEITTVAGTGGRPTQVWSGAVQTVNCRKGNATNNNMFSVNIVAPFDADCRQTLHAANNGGISPQGHLFSWCAVMRFAHLLCPPTGGWRVPTRQDFIDLDSNLGGTGGNRGGTINGVTLADQLLWYTAAAGTASAPQFGSGTGGNWGGARWTANAGDLTGAWSDYWSSTESSAMHASRLSYDANGIGPRSNGTKNNGFPVRCVRNP